MPVTLFHMGPAVVAKAAARRYISLRVFALAQIAIDLESAVNLLLQAYPTHGHLHTFVGASFIGVLAAAVGRYAFNALNPSVRLLLGNVTGMPAWFVAELQQISWSAALLSGIVGTTSHVALDAVIHPDVQPFWPWSGWNPLLAGDTFSLMHYACGGLGIVGSFWWLSLARRHPRESHLP